MKRKLLFLVAALGLLGLFPLYAAKEKKERFLVRAGRIYVGDGTVVENGAVLIDEGRIIRVGPLEEMPDAEKRISSASGVVTPGLIDAASTAGLMNKSSWTEHASEVVPWMRVLDDVDLASRDFDHLLREGVTAVFVTPGSGSVIGCRGCVVKTGGPATGRVVVAEASVKASLGRDSYRRGLPNRTPRGEATFLTRRPTTRMGVTAVFREAFQAAQAYRAARKRGGPAAPPRDPALETLAGVLDGEVPFRVMARKDTDIWSAIRLCNEFGIGFVLEEAIEAERCLPELKKSGVPVVYGPIFAYPTGWRAGTGEANRPCLGTAAHLAGAGLLVALTAGDRTGEGSLPRQAEYAIRGGMPFEAALAAVTAAPARILGLEGRIGKLKPGLDADLVLWSGEPFHPASRPIAVVVGGAISYIMGIGSGEMKSLESPPEEPGEEGRDSVRRLRKEKEPRGSPLKRPGETRGTNAVQEI